MGYTDYTSEEVLTVYQGLDDWRTYASGTILAGAEDSSRESNPLFLGASVYQSTYSSSLNFAPATGSLALGRAVALAQVGTGATGTTLDLGIGANLFRDDLGIGEVWGTGITILGDSILVGNGTDGYDLVRVTGKDYTAGTLTVDHSITTVTGDRVYIWRNGAIANNIGAIGGTVTGAPAIVAP